MEVLTEEQINAVTVKKTSHLAYKAMYSSWYGGFVTKPHLMQVPVDDHLVHRGDGVFEAVRYNGDRIFEWDAHVARLRVSAERIGLKLPVDKAELEKIVHKLIEIAKVKEGILRIFISRGPGDFSPNPYTTLGSQLYVVAMAFTPPPAQLYTEGASLIISSQPAKPNHYAQIKSCNYLPNVMTKKEAVDRKADFAINLTLNDMVAEGPTENILILNSERELCAPDFDYTLRGTTLLKVFEIAKSLQHELNIKSVGTKNIFKSDLENAVEIMMVGTTLGVLPVTRLESKKVGNGNVGTVAKRLNSELNRSMH